MKTSNVKKLLISCFYLTILTLVSIKIVETVFTGSVLVSQRKSVSEMRQEKYALLEKKQKLEQELAQSQALVELEVELASYIPIQNPIVVDQSQTVAYR